MVSSSVRFTQKGGVEWVLFHLIFLGQKWLLLLATSLSPCRRRLLPARLTPADAGRARPLAGRLPAAFARFIRA
jgi:hypothetical protein